MTHRGPFQPRTFRDSVILWVLATKAEHCLEHCEDLELSPLAVCSEVLNRLPQLLATDYINGGLNQKAHSPSEAVGKRWKGERRKNRKRKSSKRVQGSPWALRSSCCSCCSCCCPAVAFSHVSTAFYASAFCCFIYEPVCPGFGQDRVNFHRTPGRGTAGEWGLTPPGQTEPGIPYHVPSRWVPVGGGGAVGTLSRLGSVRRWCGPRERVWFCRVFFSLSVSLLLLFPLFAVLLNCPYPDPPVSACFLSILLRTPAGGGAAAWRFCCQRQPKPKHCENKNNTKINRTMAYRIREGKCGKDVISSLCRLYNRRKSHKCRLGSFDQI